ncbi:MAG: ABC transporter ATP-binding protein [Anaerolineales bacterium]
MDREIAVRTRGLVKSYGNVQALRGLDLEVREGEIYGYLGPNGSGKSTTIRCLLDLIRPQAGLVRVLGLDPQAKPVEVRLKVGYLPGELHLDENLTGQTSLRFFNELRGRAAECAYIDELAGRLKVDLGRPIRNLSHGNKQKIGLIQALMHRPQLLLLDEPTKGLDPLMQQEVLELLREAKEGGTTVFFSSHVIGEVEALAERVAIIRQGVVVEVAEIDALRARAIRRAHVRFKQPVDGARILDLPGVQLLSQDDDSAMWLQVRGDMDVLVKTLAQFPVADIETQRPSLEEIFLAYYQSDHEEA